MSRFKRLTSGIVLIAVATPALGQNVPTRTLSKPDAEFSEPFTYLSMIRELKDGRVIVIDPAEKTLQVVDLARGTSTRLGRGGSGPGEYAIPFRLLALPGDTTAMSDMVNSRLLLINPNATVGGFIDPTIPPPAGVIRYGGGGTMPTEADSKGRMYYQAMRYRRTQSGSELVDSVPMIRWERASGTRDTVAWVRQTQNLYANRSNGRTTYSVPPFGGSDQMLVAPDGRVAIVHHDPYSVDFISETGQRTRGEPIRYEKQRITEDHKAEWRSAQKGRTNVMTTVDASGRSTTTEPAGQQPDPAVWGGEYMPPFVERALMFSNDGYLWIRRTGAAGQPPTFDVIDGAGKLVQHVVLPKRARLVGFGNGAVYIARLDQDDLQYLQKHKLTMP